MKEANNAKGKELVCRSGAHWQEMERRIRERKEGGEGAASAEHHVCAPAWLVREYERIRGSCRDPEAFESRYTAF